MRLDKREVLRQELDKTLDKTLDQSRFVAKGLKNKGLLRRDPSPSVHSTLPVFFASAFLQVDV